MFCLILVLQGCNTDGPKSEVVSDSASVNAVPGSDRINKDDCANGIMAALITPADVETIIHSGHRKIYMQFKTDDDHAFYPVAYIEHSPFDDVSSYFRKNLAEPLFFPSKPYILGNLEWKLPAHADTDIQYYALFPVMDDDNIHVTYHYHYIPYTFEYEKDKKSYTLDSTFFQGLPEDQRIELIAYVAMTAGTAINPVPPKSP
jgi:hypothetical protein